MRYRPLATIVMVLLPCFAQAADPCAGSLSAVQIRDCLAAPAPELKRGIRLGRGVTGESETAPPRETSVNLIVNFEFNSARLSTDGMISLDALGKALSDPALRNDRFRIAGHTDAVGSDSYNQQLSEARAMAVRIYLGQHHRLDPANFEVVGYGKTQLYDRDDPTAAINRRVQVSKLAR